MIPFWKEKPDAPASLRHSSITYKLKLNGGDVKAVQGDSGHAQASMVTEVYSHILDDDRKKNAALFEKAFYSGKGSEGISENSGSAESVPAKPQSDVATNQQHPFLLRDEPGCSRFGARDRPYGKR